MSIAAPGGTSNKEPDSPSKTSSNATQSEDENVSEYREFYLGKIKTFGYDFLPQEKFKYRCNDILYINNSYCLQQGVFLVTSMRLFFLTINFDFCLEIDLSLIASAIFDDQIKK